MGRPQRCSVRPSRSPRGHESCQHAPPLQPNSSRLVAHSAATGGGGTRRSVPGLCAFLGWDWIAAGASSSLAVIGRSALGTPSWAQRSWGEPFSGDEPDRSTRQLQARRTFEAAQQPEQLERASTQGQVRPNQRCTRLEPKSAFSATSAGDGPSSVPRGACPLTNVTSTFATWLWPNSR